MFLRRSLPSLSVCLILAGQPGWAQSVPAPSDLPSLPFVGEFPVQRVEANGVVDLTDGSRVSLAGIELPQRPLRLPIDTPWPAAEQATAALGELAGGGPVALYGNGTATDRYGRRSAQVVTADGRWLQTELLRRGWARVAATADSRSGAAAMLAAEAEARRAGRGIWRLPDYRVRRSDETPRLVGSIQLVEGRVASSRLIKGDLVLHLGGNWRRSLTVQVPRAVFARFDDDPSLAPFGADPRRMTGRRLRIRGWIGKTVGPVVEVIRPEQIEMLDGTNRAEER